MGGFTTNAHNQVLWRALPQVVAQGLPDPVEPELHSLHSARRVRREPRTPPRLPVRLDLQS